MQVVLWQPPGAILEESIKDTSSPSSESSKDNKPSNSSPASATEASMDCATELTSQLSPPGGGQAASSKGNSPVELRSVSPGNDWGANVQLFDSVDDDDMDL